MSTSAHVRGVDGLKWRRTAVGGCASSLHCAWYSPTDIASVVSSLSDVGLESLSPMLLSHASGADASGAISEGWLALRAGAGTAPASSLLKQRFAFAPCLLFLCAPLADREALIPLTKPLTPPPGPPFLLLTSGLSPVWDTGAIAIWRSLTTEPSIIPLYCGGFTVLGAGRSGARTGQDRACQKSRIAARISHQLGPAITNRAGPYAPAWPLTPIDRVRTAGGCPGH